MTSPWLFKNIGQRASTSGEAGGVRAEGTGDVGGSKPLTMIEHAVDTDRSFLGCEDSNPLRVEQRQPRLARARAAASGGCLRRQRSASVMCHGDPVFHAKHPTNGKRKRRGAMKKTERGMSQSKKPKSHGGDDVGFVHT